MRQQREIVEPSFGTMKARMGATHLLTKTLAECRRQNGIQRSRLQYDTGHEHRRRQAAHGKLSPSEAP
jgi:hypothetical protein